MKNKKRLTSQANPSIQFKTTHLQLIIQIIDCLYYPMGKINHGYNSYERRINHE